MKNAIEFVKHGVLNRQFEEPLTEIHAIGDTIQSYNGRVRMSHPLKGIGKFSVGSATFLKAIASCNWEPDIRKTDHNLIIKKGKFRVMLPFNEMYQSQSRGKTKKRIKLQDDFLFSVKQLFPFISEDASREWSQSILIREGFMYVTNNITVIRCPVDLPDCVLPIGLVHVLVKCKLEPSYIQIGKKGVTIDFDNDAWAYGSNTPQDWPAVEHFFKKQKWNKLPEINKGFIDAVELIAPFCTNDELTFTEGKLVTDISEVREVGSPDCCLSSINTQRVLKIFTHADFSQYPKPIPMKGLGIQGIMAGIKNF